MKLEEAKKKCLCPGCPSYVDCKEHAFCLTTGSKCIKIEKGCLCGGCPVHEELKFRHGYYCTRGSEKIQAK